jgi:LysM repeat protein
MFRSPARLFAPLALVACAVAILVIVNANSGSGGSNNPTTATTTSTTTAKQGTKKPKRHYIVKEGDVMSQIAIKTGVPLETLLRLNPGVDAQSLHVGQKLKLTP